MFTKANFLAGTMVHQGSSARNCGPSGGILNWSVSWPSEVGCPPRSFAGFEVYNDIPRWFGELMQVLRSTISKYESPIVASAGVELG